MLVPFLQFLWIISFSEGFTITCGILNLAFFYLCFKTILERNRNKRNFITLISISVFIIYNLVIFPFLNSELEIAKFILQDIFIFLFGIAILLIKVDFNRTKIFENNSEKGILKK